MSFIRQALRCLYRFDEYPGLTEKPISFAFTYVAFIGAAFCMAATIAFYVEFAPAMKRAVAWAADNVPPITLQNGKISTTPATPVTLHPPEDIGGDILIDSSRTSAVSEEEMEKQNLGLYLTQDAAYARHDGQVEMYPFDTALSSAPVTFNANFFHKAGKVASIALYPGFFFLTWSSFIFWTFLAALFYSIFGITLSATTGKGLAYNTLYKLAIYAQTPVVALQILLAFSPWTPPPAYALGAACLLIGLYSGLAMRHYSAVPPEPPSHDEPGNF